MQTAFVQWVKRFIVWLNWRAQDISSLPSRSRLISAIEERHYSVYKSLINKGGKPMVPVGDHPYTPFKSIS